MSAAPTLFANLGAEEGDGWPRMAAHPRVRAAARLWSALFPAGARALGPSAPPLDGLLDPIAADGERAAFDFCAGGARLVPWLATEEARAWAERAGLPLAGAPPELVARVHDKGFALEAARARGALPPELAASALALGPEDLGAADAVRCRIEAEVASWPAPFPLRFVLKPRLGTSGRGRLEGREGRLDPDALRGALPRFRACGGCLVEPWLERVVDLSAQLWIAPDGAVQVLGTLEQVMTRAGVPLGHRGELGREVSSGSRWDPELRAAALAIGGAAADAGYTGACGVDAFAYLDSAGVERLRPVVELNARFTAGISALGVLARARRLGLLEGRRTFHVGVESGLAGGERLALLAGDPDTALWLG